jgi:hypothetical protein
MRFSAILSVAAIGLAVALGGAEALAKAHDQGKADGTQPVPPGGASHVNYPLGRGSIVSGVDTPGLGSGVKNPDICKMPVGPTCGVAAERELDLTYGQNVVRPRVIAGTNGVNGGKGPVTNDGAPGQTK